jgi:hypothetical protein
MGKIFLKWVKFFVAVLLLPLCGGLAVALGKLVVEFGGSESFWGRPLLFFSVGFGMWVIIFFLLPAPTKTYVLGHELTHALWAVAMGGRARGLKVGKTGGQVRVSRTNFLVVLAPYFFPFYTVVAGFLWWVASLIWDASGWEWVLFYVAGLTWAFHLTFTGLALAQPQTDVKAHGWLFSMVVIFCANILVTIGLMGLLNPNVKWTEVGALVGREMGGAYVWVVKTAMNVARR